LGLADRDHVAGDQPAHAGRAVAVHEGAVGGVQVLDQVAVLPAREAGVPARRIPVGTERDVDPMRLLLVEGRSYLEAWCRQAEAMRTFRLDRFEAATLLDEPARLPEDVSAEELTAMSARSGAEDGR